MSTTAVRTPAEYEAQLQKYFFERSEESRAVRVGEKEVSEQAAIVARYRDLFSRAQLEALREAEHAAAGDERERLYRLRKTCEGGLVSAELAEQEDALENAILGARVTFDGEEMPLRSAQARLAVLDVVRRPRGRSASWSARRPPRFNADRLALIDGRRASSRASSRASPTPSRATRRRRRSRCGSSSACSSRRRMRRRRPTAACATRGSRSCSAPSVTRCRRTRTSHYLRRLSPLESTYTKERSVDVCMASVLALGFDMTAIPNIRLDLEDRPQKNPRACVIASDPPDVVHLITRAQGGLADYQAFMHEAGHALHYAGVDPRLPYTFRRISRDHALTEIYSYIFEAITREPGWHALHFGLYRRAGGGERAGDALPRGAALSPLHREAAVRARLLVELRGGAAARLERDYATLLTEATGIRYDPRGYVADMDSGFYSADYLRAWIRSAQLRASPDRRARRRLVAQRADGRHPP